MHEHSPLIWFYQQNDTSITHKKQSDVGKPDTDLGLEECSAEEGPLASAGEVDADTVEDRATLQRHPLFLQTRL